MFRKISQGLAISFLAIVLVGCGTPTAKTQQENSQQQSTQQKVEDQTPKTDYLKPAPQGTSVVDSNLNVSKQIMEQKDVLGTSVYEQQGITYGDITFKSGVDKTYAHNLALEFLAQLKKTYPNKAVTAQALSDGKTIDSISFKP
ncbi:hypothetical protein ACHOLT_05915 [Desulfitobacterium sp. Sab5]|uniref:hypothetical protein n=1 Tax=Desulfitobacterium nosdiversum TaxID=3375356 RepID=UPI003CF09822